MDTVVSCGIVHFHPIFILFTNDLFPFFETIQKWPATKTTFHTQQIELVNSLSLCTNFSKQVLNVLEYIFIHITGNDINISPEAQCFLGENNHPQAF